MPSVQVNSASAAGRYAVAIYELAQESKILPRVGKELLSLQKALRGSADLLALAASPMVGASQKVAVFQALASKAKFSPLMVNFVGLVCENGRAADLSDMVDGFGALVDQAKGTLQANAITAQDLSAQQKKNLASGLKKALGRTVKLKTEVDSRLLGGLVVQIGSVMFDSSLKTQLEGLKLAMKES
ncbi:MAG: ATP synthase F1 subunit delta [Robiginitomaculum sp.]|nr:MAG: ATP synthase F1 subunit delta [Robiginitomaculum sp.]